MNNLIGKILNGTIAGEDATFEVVEIKKDERNLFNEDLILSCVEFGAPLIKISLSEINNPVRA
jgi:hypothetical protein